MLTVLFNCPEGYLLDYLKHMFPPDQEGRLQVSTRKDLGRLMVGMARSSPSPRKDTEPRERFACCTMRLPDGDSTQHLRNGFLYYTKGDMTRLLDTLRAVFNLDLLSYYYKGLGLGFRKKDILEAFVVSRGLAENTPYEALHKRIYRIEQKRRSSYARQLARKVEAYTESIDTSELL